MLAISEVRNVRTSPPAPVIVIDAASRRTMVPENWLPSFLSVIVADWGACDFPHPATSSANNPRTGQAVDLNLTGVSHFYLAKPQAITVWQGCPGGHAFSAEPYLRRAGAVAPLEAVPEATPLARNHTFNVPCWGS